MLREVLHLKHGAALRPRDLAAPKKAESKTRNYAPDRSV
ncbi:hypothetical protein GLE_4691 [Lysobacter enzymogenes]|uniref:Uncharacterized protein n=1 Tax=Lysobacter enzymogenes TaxID=69 RepID=A0A0S2DNB2_LYSEN|nr:hypothetical protein GLE_4691 [Lysobacter enzymogenes]